MSLLICWIQEEAPTPQCGFHAVLESPSTRGHSSDAACLHYQASLPTILCAPRQTPHIACLIKNKDLETCVNNLLIHSKKSVVNSPEPFFYVKRTYLPVLISHRPSSSHWRLLQHVQSISSDMDTFHNRRQGLQLDTHQLETDLFFCLSSVPRATYFIWLQRGSPLKPASRS